MWEYTYVNPPDLYHHGILGMKWGVRRFQNPDGSLTSVGKKRRGSNENDAQKPPKKSTPSKKKSEETSTKKSVSEMTDDEIRQAIARKTLENDYNKYYPKQITRGQKFVKGVIEKVVVPAAVEAGKSLAKDFLETEGRKALGLPAKKDGGSKKK